MPPSIVKVTVPAGTPVPDCGPTTAVTSTVCPNEDGLAEAWRAIVVAWAGGMPTNTENSPSELFAIALPARSVTGDPARITEYVPDGEAAHVPPGGLI